MHGTSGAALALHLLHHGNVAPDVGHALGGPLVGKLSHGGGRRDREDRAYFVHAIGDVRHRSVAIHDGTLVAHAGTPCSVAISIAWHGHCSKHVPQPVHVVGLTLYPWPIPSLVIASSGHAA